MARQLKTMLRARKAQMLGCGPCECLTLKCRRENEEYCGCGGAVQQIEITPMPGAEQGQFTFTGPNGEQMAMLGGSGDFGGVVAVMNMDYFIPTAGLAMGFIITSEIPEGAETLGMKIVVDEELANSISAELESLPEGGKLSAKTSKVILDNYNDVVKTTIVLKNPRLEEIEHGDETWNYYLMDLYDYEKDTFLGTYDFANFGLQSPGNKYIVMSSLIDYDMADFIYGLVDDTDYSDWSEGVAIDGVVYLPYEYSKAFREALALTGLHAPVYGWAAGVDAYEGDQDCDYMYNVNFETGLIEVKGLLSNIWYNIEDTVETWELLGNDCGGIIVTKENDVYTITTQQEMLQPLVSVLQGLSDSTRGAMFFQCDNLYLTQDVLGIFRDIYLNPTQAKIASAIETLEAWAQRGVELVECGER